MPSRDARGLHSKGSPFSGQIESGSFVRSDLRERAVLIAIIQIFRRGDAGLILAAELRQRLRQQQELLRVPIGQLTDQHGVHQAEDGGIGADSQRKSDDGDRREPWVPAKHANAEAEIT